MTFAAENDAQSFTLTKAVSIRYYFFYYHYGHHHDHDHHFLLLPPPPLLLPGSSTSESPSPPLFCTSQQRFHSERDFRCNKQLNTPSQQKQNRGRSANNVVRRNTNGPAVVDVVARIAVVGEACADAELRGKLPNRVRQRTADAGDPTSSKLHRHAAKTLLPDPSADSIRRLQNHHVLDAVLRQHLRRSDTLKSKQTQ